MCGENEPKIPVYWFNNDGITGPCSDSIEGVLEDVREALESWSIEDRPVMLKVTTGIMKQSEYDNLPEFEGY